MVQSDGMSRKCDGPEVAQYVENGMHHQIEGAVRESTSEIEGLC